MSYANYGRHKQEVRHKPQPPLKPKKAGRVAAVAHAAVAKAVRKVEPPPAKLAARWLAQKGREVDKVLLEGTIDARLARDGTASTFTIYKQENGKRGAQVAEVKGKVKKARSLVEWTYEHEHKEGDIDPKAYKEPRFSFDFEANKKKAEARPIPFVGFCEFVYEDDKGNPLADYPYLVKLANGEERKGRTDEGGRVRLEDLPPGRIDIQLDL